VERQRETSDEGVVYLVMMPSAMSTIMPVMVNDTAAQHLAAPLG